jgi:lauroyl/myristoyl acyltransferase
MIFLIKLISLLPLWLLYFLADFAQLTLRLIGYREEVIHGNLTQFFFEKSEQEDVRCSIIAVPVSSIP